jgi:plastocyanin
MTSTTLTRRNAVLAAAGALVLVGVAACGGGSSAGAPAAINPPATSPASAGGGGGGGSQSHTVTVTETEFHLALTQSSFTPGTYTFIAKNAGSTTHALAINGPGVANRSTGDLNPGQSASLTVTLAKGTYDIYCPVGEHKMLGMDAHVTVT